MDKHILIVEDEQDIADLVAYNARKSGFRTTTVSDGEEALRRVRGGSFDLVVLDLMLPGIQGRELCRIIREDPRTARLPVIMLTAKGEETDRIAGLELGADDYITKPFSPRELIARIKAVLRRTRETGPHGTIIRLGDLTIDTGAFTVTRGAKPIELSATEFRLLLYLVERKGRVFSRDQLVDAVWKAEAFVEPRTVDVHVRRIRAQIEADPSAPAYLKTRRGIGYYVEGDA